VEKYLSRRGAACCDALIVPQPARGRDRPCAFLERIVIEIITTVSKRLARPIETFETLRHSNGKPAAMIYGPRDFDRRSHRAAAQDLAAHRLPG
jgi:hypothetical protein